jgi:hypothetical protein
MRSHLTHIVLAGAALLLMAAPGLAQGVYYPGYSYPGYYYGGYSYPGYYYSSRPVVSGFAPRASVAVATPYASVYVGPSPVVTSVYAPGVSFTYSAAPAYYARPVRPWYGGGYYVAPTYYYYR